MIHKPIHYTHHAARELKKARLTRQIVRDVLAQGVRRVEAVTARGTYHASTLYVGQRPVEAIWIEFPSRVLVVTVYVVGEYD